MGGRTPRYGHVTGGPLIKMSSDWLVRSGTAPGPATQNLCAVPSTRWDRPHDTAGESETISSAECDERFVLPPTNEKEDQTDEE